MRQYGVMRHPGTLSPVGGRGGMERGRVPVAGLVTMAVMAAAAATAQAQAPVSPIVLGAEDPAGAARWARVAPDGTDLGTLPSPADASPLPPSVSPDGGRIAYVQRVTDPVIGLTSTELWIEGADGAAPRRVAGATDDIRGVTAVRWAPTGDRIGFLAVVGSEADPFDTRWAVLVVRPDGGGLQRVTGQAAETTAGGTPPPGFAWTPDGRSVVHRDLVTDPSALAPGCTAVLPAQALVVTDLATGATRLTGDRCPTERQEGVDLSRDGRSLSYLTDDGTTRRLWIAPRRGGAARLVLATPVGRDGALARDYGPAGAFSPDGARLLVTLTAGAGREAALVPADGAPPVPVPGSALPGLRSGVWEATGAAPPADGDGDGVPDDEDICPQAPDPDQADTDGDGQGDACDADADGNGIADDVADGEDGFSDGRTRGVLLDRGGNTVTVQDAADPAEGVVIEATGGDVAARFEVCGGTVLDVEPGARVVLTCDGVTVRSERGRAVLVLSRRTRVTVPSGGAVRLVRIARDRWRVQNRGPVPIPIATDGRAALVPVGGSSPLAAWVFRGFGPPLVPAGRVNRVTAGRPVPLRWTLTREAGGPVTDLATARITSAVVPCTTPGTPVRLPDAPPDKDGLVHLGRGAYRLAWNTPGSFRGSCRVMRLDIGSGVTYQAMFRFRP